MQVEAANIWAAVQSFNLITPIGLEVKHLELGEILQTSDLGKTFAVEEESLIEVHGAIVQLPFSLEEVSEVL
jgi:hypothetical protein